MKVSRLTFAAACAVLVFAIPGNSCGPFFPEAIFVQDSMPDGPYAAYAGGQIGIPQPGYRVEDLVVAYDWLNGHGLTATEQQQAVALDHTQIAGGYNDPAKLPGYAAWLDAHNGFLAPAATQDKKSRLPTNDGVFDPDRRVPAESYRSFANCLDPAFATAAATLNTRKAAHTDDRPSLLDWLQGQDAVFANCNGSGDKMPADVPANAPTWLKQDRAYQQAAAKFYQTDYDGAITRLNAIAADTSSPWHEIARLIAARALIRRATIGQITELPAAAVATPGASYSEEREKVQRAYAELLKQKEPARLADARTALDTIIADPAMQNYHADAAGLLEFVNLRLEPGKQANVLATRLTAADRAQTPGRFQQALIDLRYALYPPYSNQPHRPMTLLPASTGALLVWIDAMRSFAPFGTPDRGGSDDGTDAAKARQTRTRLAGDAFARWHATHDDTWLIAALSNARPDESEAAELIQAARQIPKDSPAWTAATYNRLRLMPDPSAMRAALIAVQPEIQHAPQRSTINLFKLLNQRTAPTLADFLHDAAALPAGITIDTDYPDPPDSNPKLSGLCGVNGSQATTLLFNPDAATILNTRMPLALLADAAADTSLPRNLSFQIAQSTWTRAVLLNQPDIGRRMSPILTGCYPAWKPWLDGYDSAKTPDDRRAAGLLALMRFPSTEPLVRPGMQRPEGFATYSPFRDNWWTGGSGNPYDTGARSALPPLFFSTTPATRAALPDPPFLTAADRAAAEREIATLRATPCASDYFAAAALDWQKQHPADPRTPDILGFAERAVRNGCRTKATADLNHRLFLVVQTKYPKSEWAMRYTSWE